MPWEAYVVLIHVTGMLTTANRRVRQQVRIRGARPVLSAACRRAALRLALILEFGAAKGSRIDMFEAQLLAVHLFCCNTTDGILVNPRPSSQAKSMGQARSAYRILVVVS